MHVAFGFGQDIQRKGYGLTCGSVLLQRIVGHGESMMTNDWLPVVLPEVWRLKWVDFRQVIQYFNKHGLSDWKIRFRAEGWKMTICSNRINAPETLMLPGWFELRWKSDCFNWFSMICPLHHPQVDVGFWAEICVLVIDQQDFLVPSPACFVWGERCCPRFKDPRGSGSKHTHIFGGLRAWGWLFRIPQESSWQCCFKKRCHIQVWLNLKWWITWSYRTFSEQTGLRREETVQLKHSSCDW